MTDGLGNETQTRIIAEQLFKVWEAKQEAKSKEARRWFGNNISGWVSVAIVVLGTLYAGSQTFELAQQADARSLRNEAAIAVIKADTADRLARIETKLDLIIGERDGAR